MSRHHIEDIAGMRGSPPVVWSLGDMFEIERYDDVPAQFVRLVMRHTAPKYLTIDLEPVA